MRTAHSLPFRWPAICVQPAWGSPRSNSVPCDIGRRNPVMKALSAIGLLFTAAIIATIPISPQVTPRGVELSVNQAQAATYRHSRRVNRQVYGNAYRGGYYGAPGYYSGYYYGGNEPVGGGGGQWYP